MGRKEAGGGGGGIRIPTLALKLKPLCRKVNTGNGRREVERARERGFSQGKNKRNLIRYFQLIPKDKCFDSNTNKIPGNGKMQKKILAKMRHRNKGCISVIRNPFFQALAKVHLWLFQEE